MAGFSERQAVESLPRIKKQQRDLQTTDTYYKPQQPNTEETGTQRIVKGLISLADSGTEVYQNRKQKKIELDKVTQTQRAIRGLDPSEGATAEGQRAYQVVKMRDETLDANAELSNAIKENPDMTDEEYELMTREVYSGMLDKYKDDPQLAAAASNQIQQSQGQMHQIRATAKAKHEEWKNMEALNTGITEYTQVVDGDIGQLAQIIGENGQLANEADALGITPQKFREKLIERATIEAANGEGDLLRAIQTKDWSEGDPRVEKADQQFKQWELRNNSVQIGAMIGEAQDAYFNREISKQDMLGRLDAINNRFPGAVTKSTVSSSIKRGQVKLKQASEKDILLNNHFSGKYGDTPVGDNPLYSESEKKTIMGKEVELASQYYRKQVDSGEMTPEEAQQGMTGSLLKISREQRMEIPRVKSQVRNALDINIEDMDGDIPPPIMNGMASLEMMTDSDRRRYLTESGLEVMNVYDRFKETPTGEVDKNAYTRALRVRDGNSDMTFDEKEQLQEDAADHLDERLSGGFWNNRWDNLKSIGIMVPWGESSTKPSDANMNLLRNKVRDYALAINKTGSGDTDRAVEQGADRVENSHSFTPSGAVIERRAGSLAKDMQYVDGNGQRRIATPKQATEAADYRIKQLLPVFQRESGFRQDLTPADVVMSVSDSGIVNYRDTDGTLLMDHSDTLADMAQGYFATTRQERIDALDDGERVERQKRADEALESWGDFGSGF